MPVTILVTGATGNVGYEVAKALETTPASIRLAVRNVKRAKTRIEGGTENNGTSGRDNGSSSEKTTRYEYVHFDFADPTTFGPVLEGVQKMFLVRPPELADITIFQPLIDAAKQSPTFDQIVFLSIQGIKDLPSHVPHAQIEKAICEAGLPYTFLRAGFFMQNLDTTHREDIQKYHDLFVPASNSQTAFIDVRDIGAVAAHVMTTNVPEGASNTHVNKEYTLTGSELLTYYDVAAVFSSVLPFDVSYSNPYLLHFAWRFRRRGTPTAKVAIMCFLYVMTRFGQAAVVTDTVEKLLGRPPISMSQYVKDYKGSWTAES